MMEHDEGAAPGAEEARGEEASRWEDYVDVFFSPVELFHRRAADRIMPPLVTLLLLAIAIYFLMLPANSMVMRASVGDNPDAAVMVDRFGRLFQVLGSIFVPITYIIVLALAAAVLLLVSRLAGIRAEFSRMMLVATYAGFVYLLAQIAGGLAVMLHGEAGLDVVRHLSFGPLRFVGSTELSPVTTALLRRFELFTLWQAALWGLGVAVVYRVSRARGMAVAAVAWALITVPAVLLAMFGLGQGPRGG
jgi:hypothetical protein